MLTQLLNDAEALVDALPGLQDAIDAVQSDLGGSLDLAKLKADSAALATAASEVKSDIEALQADLTALPQAVHGEWAESLKEMITINPQRACRLATFAVWGLQIAVAFGVAIPPQVITAAQALQQQVCSIPSPTEDKEGGE